MALFSQRKGIRPVTKSIQRESLDEDLRNRLWSALKIGLWDHWSPRDYSGFQYEDGKRVEFIVKLVWRHYFKLSVDTLPAFDRDHPRSSYEVMRDHFFDGEWWESYDLIEYLVKVCPEQWQDRLKKLLNSFMESENAAYRIVGDEVVEISDEHELKAVESALETAEKPKATLGGSIKVIKKNRVIHPAFEHALLKLYGYTSDEGGIRHALTEDSVEIPIKK